MFLRRREEVIISSIWKAETGRDHGSGGVTFYNQNRWI